MTAPSTETILKALRVTEFDYTRSLWWRTGSPENEADQSVHVFVPCSDIFFWGCADVEEITDDNVGALVATITEAEALLGKWNAEDAFLLWVARQRGVRPQGGAYQFLDQSLWHLFDAAGPAREVSLGNPKPRPQDPTP